MKTDCLNTLLGEKPAKEMGQQFKTHDTEAGNTQRHCHCVGLTFPIHL